MTIVDPKESFDLAIQNIKLPKKNSHKGQNGRLLIIGGSKIFHAASLWSAEIASRFVDLVHYYSTKENQQIFINLKSKFTNGIVIPKNELLSYVVEDDCILVGPGMERGDIDSSKFDKALEFEDIVALENEAEYTYALIKFFIEKYPKKQFIFDAAALQMMDKDWLKKLHTKAIVTPHSKEFLILFGQSVDNIDEKAKKSMLINTAQEYNCIIMLKHVTDYASDGKRLVTIEGGNAGLSKGGSGDVLAGLISAFNTQSDSMTSCIIASYMLKSAADILYDQSGLFYNTSDLIVQIGKTAKKILIDI